MTRQSITAALALLGLGFFNTSLGSAQIAGAANINLAEARYRLGAFTEAAEMAAAVLDEDANNFRAVLLRTRVALLENRLSDAEALARRAGEIRPTHRAPREILAEIHSRRGEALQAAPLYLDLRRKALAKREASFEGRRPFAANSAGATIAFAQTDPVPILDVIVNGAAPEAFLLDTGTGEVVLEAAWASAIGLEDHGTEKEDGEVIRFARADTVELGSLELRDVPVSLVDEVRAITTADERPVRGILGTSFLSRFRATLDYPAGRLILAAPGSTPLAQEFLARIPFYWTPERGILVRGRLNDQEPDLLLLATGIPALGFAAPATTLEEAGIELLQGSPGGPGAPLPFMLESLSLGELTRTFVPGVLGPFPAGLEHSLGFHVGGLVSDGFLRPYRVTIDFTSMELFIHPASG